MLRESHPKIEYRLLGERYGIGATCHYLKLGRWGILLDAGLDVTKSGIEALPDFEVIANEPVNAILISHAHLDHVGALPVAIQYFPHARVYMTPATVELAEKMLYHYIHVQRKRALEKWEALQLPYTPETIEMVRFLFQSFDYNVPFHLHGYEESGIGIQFFDAGHILGSAGILIEWGGWRIFYTGNTRKSAQVILKGARYPRKVDVLLTESTYGANRETETVNYHKEVKRFSARLKERLQLGGVVLIPVFALGRTQEILAMVHQLRVRNKIPGVPIYLNGFGLEVNKTYDRLLHKIYPKYSRGMLKQMLFGRWNNRKQLKGPAILISTSGMMFPNSPSFDFAQQLVSDPKNGIFFVGYADPETPAGLLQRVEASDSEYTIGGQKIICPVERFYFSAHSNHRELLEMIKNISPGAVLLSHGERKALQSLQEELAQLRPDISRYIPNFLEKIIIQKSGSKVVVLQDSQVRINSG